MHDEAFDALIVVVVVHVYDRYPTDETDDVAPDSFLGGPEDISLLPPYAPKLEFTYGKGR